MTGFLGEGGRFTAVETNHGPIAAGKVGLAVAGHTWVVAQKAGLEPPIESHVLQTFVTEPLKPIVDHVVAYGTEHFYVSQSDKAAWCSAGRWTGTTRTRSGATSASCGTWRRRRSRSCPASRASASCATGSVRSSVWS